MDEKKKEIIVIFCIILLAISMLLAVYDICEKNIPTFNCPEDYSVTDDNIKEIDGINYGKCEYIKEDYEIINNEFVKINNIHKPVIVKEYPIPIHGFLFKSIVFIGTVCWILLILLFIYVVGSFPLIKGFN